MAEGKSIRWVTIAALLFVLYVGWGLMAGSYAGGAHAGAVISGRRGGAGIGLMASAVFSFVATSIMELPNFFAVMSWHSSNRIWLPILILIVAVGVCGGGYGLHKLEQNLSKPRRKKRR